MNNKYESLPKIVELLDGFHTAMLVTHSGGRGLRARPMAIANLGLDAQLKFITDIETSKVIEVEMEQHCLVVCQKEGGIYLDMEGIATVSQDREEIDALWKEPFKIYFPDGKDDPSICIIHFRPERVEYWDNSGLNKLAFFWEAAKAYVSGTLIVTDNNPQQHGVLQL